MIYFWSGSNRAGEIRALSECAVPVGVTVSELDSAGHALRELARCKSPIFVDSGAFGEIRWNSATMSFDDVRPIGPHEWTRRLELYHQIVRARPGTYMVAPDKVGDQEETLARLSLYRNDIWELHRMGAQMIVPLQRGELSQVEFDRKVNDCLSGLPYIRGIPSKKAAATTAEIHKLSSELPDSARLHFLGLGPTSPRYNEILAGVQQSDLSCDSCRILALVGKTNGPGGGPRPLTAHVERIKAHFGLGRRLSTEESFMVKYLSLKAYLEQQCDENR